MDILKKNFFELFNIDIAIDVNKSELDEKVKILQSKFHPDKYANGSDFEKRLALQISSHINDGYKVLSDIVLRIDYILKINNFVKDESKTINDVEFLQEQIKYSELVENIKDNFDQDIIDDYLLNIKEDLIPLCPNCHSMVHKRTPPYTVQELKDIISNLD